MPVSAPEPPRTPDAPSSGVVAARPLARVAWACAGLLLVGVGTLGVLLPVLPSTVFFIGAAACFARSSPRLERWVLGLPHVGPLVRDYRSGLGMPRRAKRVAAVAITVAVTLSAVALPSWLGRGGVMALGLVGVWYVMTRVPTREQVQEERARRERQEAPGRSAPVPTHGNGRPGANGPSPGYAREDAPSSRSGTDTGDRG